MKLKKNKRKELQDKERKIRIKFTLEKLIDEHAFTWGQSFVNQIGEKMQRYHIEDANFENLLIELIDYCEEIYIEGLAEGIIERMEYEKRHKII